MKQRTETNESNAIFSRFFVSIHFQSSSCFQFLSFLCEKNSIKYCIQPHFICKLQDEKDKLYICEKTERKKLLMLVCTYNCNWNKVRRNNSNTNNNNIINDSKCEKKLLSLFFRFHCKIVSLVSLLWICVCEFCVLFISCLKLWCNALWDATVNVKIEKLQYGYNCMWLCTSL